MSAFVGPYSLEYAVISRVMPYAQMLWMVFIILLYYSLQQILASLIAVAFLNNAVDKW